MKALNGAMSIIVSLALAVGLCPGLAFAGGASEYAVATQAGNVASGTWGTCLWEIDADGTLTIHSGTGADTGGVSPWAE